jgi:RNA polymerase sigma-70 factor (ECF subfamily)
MAWGVILVFEQKGVRDVMEMDDNLGKRFAAGGEAELEEVVGVYGERLLRYAVSVLACRMDAEDVVQRALLAAYDKRRGFDGGNIGAWLYRITYNLCMNHLRKRRFLFFWEVGDVREEASVPYGDNADDGFLEVLGMIGAEDRALLYMKVVDGFSYEELSGVFGKSAAALRKRLERAKKRVIELMEGREGNERRNENPLCV